MSMTQRQHESRRAPHGPVFACAVLLAAATSLATPVLAQSLAPTPSPVPAGLSADADGDTALSPVTGAALRPGKKTRAAAPELTTGTNPRAGRITGMENATDGADFGRMNLRENSVDDLASRADPTRNEAPGIRLGTMVLRPSVTQSLGAEREKTGATTTSRTYLQTEIKGTLESDWSRHALTVTGAGLLQRNISGEGEEKPSASLDADLRLDLADRMIAHIRGGYSFTREDTDDPNAISGAKTQAGVHTLRGGVEIQRSFGVIRGTTGFDLDRQFYTDATLANGTRLSMEDRDRLSGTLRGRIGYELSPALIPFLEASVGRSRYDLRTDSQGYQRSYWTYAAKAGVELNMGEKLRGELGIGYKRAEFDDARLKALGGATVDGSLVWSPQRGTDVNFGLSTSIEPSTTAGSSGYISYGANAGISHEVRDNVIARLTGTATYRDYQGGGSDETLYTVGPGLTWGINRYLDLKGDLGYEITDRSQGNDSRTLRGLVGLTVKR